MASPYNFVTIAERELDDPVAFLPTSLYFEGEQVFWTKPGYPTYCRTPVNFEMANMTILCDPNTVILPPNLQKISESENITEHQQRCIHDYKFAATTIDHWRQNKHPGEEALTNQVAIWKQTCDNLVTSPTTEKKKPKKSSYPQTIDNKILCNQKLSSFQKGVQSFFDNLQSDTVNFQLPTELLSSFENHIVQTAVNVAAKIKKNAQTGSQSQKKH